MPQQPINPSAGDDGPVDATRSRIMRSVGRANTGPEVSVRKLLHRLKLRFRLHRRDLPGTPDVVLPRHRTAIFVHGCFWHRHPGCTRATTPKTRVDFWQAKFERNVVRDRENEQALTALGWRVLTVWECETRNPEDLVEKLRNFFR
ncbi:very short patch repair endonuclease [Sphingomonas melonis]